MNENAEAKHKTNPLKPSKAMVDKLMGLDGSKRALERLVRQCATSALANFRPFLNDADIKKIVERNLKGIDTPARMLPVYAKHFDGNDLVNLIAFYQSPTGLKLIRGQEHVSSFILNVAQEMATDLCVGCVHCAEAEMEKRRGKLGDNA
jgi:hypothetical protein